MPWTPQMVRDHLKSAGIPSLFGFNREVELLASYLWDNEQLLYGFGCNYQKSQNLAAITPTRLLLLNEQGVFKKEVHVETINLSTITSIDGSKGTLLSTVTITAANRTYLLESIPVDFKVVISFVNKARQPQSSPPPMTPNNLNTMPQYMPQPPIQPNPYMQPSAPQAAPSQTMSQKEQITNVMIEQLERLARLKEQGILTEEEFLEQKRRILSI